MASCALRTAQGPGESRRPFYYGRATHNWPVKLTGVLGFRSWTRFALQGSIGLSMDGAAAYLWA